MSKSFPGGAGPGRPKGLQNKTTMQFKEALNNLLENCAPKMLDWIERVSEGDPAKALDLTSKLAEYIYPKLSRSEHTGMNGGPIETELSYNSEGARNKFKERYAK